jgi:nitrogen fixation protein NifB
VGTLLAEPSPTTGLIRQPPHQFESHPPTPVELQALQDACAGDMAMMRHCRQCRADAVGMLGEDRGSEFTLDKIAGLDIDYAAAMQRRAAVHAAIETDRAAAQREHGGATFVSVTRLKTRRQETRPVRIAVASSGGGLINQHFGHAREFLIYEASAADVRLVGVRKVDLYCSGRDTCGDAELALQQTLRALEGCAAVLCSRIGFEPWGALEAAGIQPNGEHALEPIAEAVAAVYRELATSGALERPLPEGRRATA